MLQAGGPQAYAHTRHSNGSKGRHTRPYGNLTVIYNRVEAWYEWQIGQDRQSGHSLVGVSEQRPNSIFPPVDVVQVLPGGYMLYYLSRLPWRFFVPNLTEFVCMDHNLGPHQTLIKNE